jgi:hypothetical protein
MVFHTDGVRGGFPLAGARAARAVYTLERRATGSVPQRLCADDRAVCDLTDHDGHAHTGGYYAYQNQTGHAAIAEVPQGHGQNTYGDRPKTNTRVTNRKVTWHGCDWHQCQIGFPIL